VCVCVCFLFNATLFTFSWNCVLMQAQTCFPQSGNNDQAFASMVRQQFKANMGEFDDEKVIQRIMSACSMRTLVYTPPLTFA